MAVKELGKGGGGTQSREKMESRQYLLPAPVALVTEQTFSANCLQPTESQLTGSY